MKKKQFRFYWEEPQKPKDDQTELRLELPGFKRDEIKIKLSGNTITLSASKKNRTVEKGRGYYREEAQASSFSKSMALPQAIDPKQFDIEITDGSVIIRKRKQRRHMSKEN